MSNIYISEPPTEGKVLLKTSVGEIDIELWSKETPKACRNFVQLCMEGYYDGTVFHRVVRNFIVQGGDPTGTGSGGESIYGHTFKDEFHSRLRFSRRGLLAMANSGPNDNGSQFFFTLEAAPELNGKHTIFGKVAGNTIYNMIKLVECEIGPNDFPVSPHKIIRTEILSNPYDDIVPRLLKKKKDETGEKKAKSQSRATKNFTLLSFGEEAEEDEIEVKIASKDMRGKSKSSHDLIDDPRLSSVPALMDNTKEAGKRVLSGDEENTTGEVDEEQSERVLESVRKRLKKDDRKSVQKSDELSPEEITIRETIKRSNDERRKEKETRSVTGKNGEDRGRKDEGKSKDSNKNEKTKKDSPKISSESKNVHDKNSKNENTSKDSSRHKKDEKSSKDKSTRVNEEKTGNKLDVEKSKDSKKRSHDDKSNRGSSSYSRGDPDDQDSINPPKRVKGEKDHKESTKQRHEEKPSKDSEKHKKSDKNLKESASRPPGDVEMKPETKPPLTETSKADESSGVKSKEKDETKKLSKSEELRKEARQLKREMIEAKKKKENPENSKSVDKEESKPEPEGDALSQYFKERRKYKDLKKQQGKKGSSREDATMALLAKFQSRLQSVRNITGAYSSEEDKDEKEEEEEEEDNPADMSWLSHKLKFTENKRQVIDANVEDLNRYEIHDPRNPITKRRMENSKKIMKQKR